MSNKLVKPDKDKNKGNKDKAAGQDMHGTMKTFFSFNGFTNKVFSVYEDSRKKESAMKRSGVNQIISISVVCIAALLMGYAISSIAVPVAVICYCILSAAACAWKIKKDDMNRMQTATLITLGIAALISVIMAVMIAV